MPDPVHRHVWGPVILRTPDYHTEEVCSRYGCIRRTFPEYIVISSRVSIGIYTREPTQTDKRRLRQARLNWRPE